MIKVGHPTNGRRSFEPTAILVSSERMMKLQILMDFVTEHRELATKNVISNLSLVPRRMVYK